jgi:hypothetical protein
MKQNNITQLTDVQSYHELQMQVLLPLLLQLTLALLQPVSQCSHAYQKIVTGLGRQMIVWEEAFDHMGTYVCSHTHTLSLSCPPVPLSQSHSHCFSRFALNPNSTVINVWLSATELVNVVKASFRGIQNYPWYLDREIPDPPLEYYGTHMDSTRECSMLTVRSLDRYLAGHVRAGPDRQQQPYARSAGSRARRRG